MAFKTTKSLIIGALVAVTSISGLAFAAGGGVHSSYKMKHPDWSFNGAFGTYDRAAMQRGYQVYREVCAACHGLKYVAFRHLGDKGGPFYLEDYPNPSDNPYVKNFAADWTVVDIDSETGDEIDRKGIPADYFPPVFPNDAAARASNGGAKPEYVELTPGLHWNPVMDGNKIAMAAPLSDELVSYEPTEMMDHGELKLVDPPVATVEQMASDLTQFLAWTADPKLEQRKSTGLMTIVYLLLLFLSYKRVWRNVKH